MNDQALLGREETMPDSPAPQLHCKYCGRKIEFSATEQIVHDMPTGEQWHKACEEQRKP